MHARPGHFEELSVELDVYYKCWRDEANAMNSTVDSSNESDVRTTTGSSTTPGDDTKGRGNIPAGGWAGIVLGVGVAVILLFTAFIAAILVLKRLSSWKPNEVAIRRATHYRTSTRKRSSTFKEQTVLAANSENAGLGTERGRPNRQSDANLSKNPGES